MPDTAARERQDAELVAEGELCTTLSIASSSREDPFTQEELDCLLGVVPA